MGIILLFLIYKHSKQSQPETPTTQEISPEEVEALRSLPYANWSEEDADASTRGVTRHSTEAYDGYNLYTNDADEIYLMDMTGERKHVWRAPGRQHCEFGSLTSHADLLLVCVLDEILLLDWNSDVIWKRKMRVHHDAEALQDGTYLVIAQERPREYRSKTVIFDSLVRLSSEGNPLEEWSTDTNQQSIQPYHPPSALDSDKGIETRARGTPHYDYYHMNTIRVLPETALGQRDRRFSAGNFLICLRNADLLLILDKETKEIVWSWGPGVLEYPHAPVMLQNGHILVFDNGTRRKFSRILEMDPETSQLVWEYRGRPKESFFSPWQGYVQRLPNGNTLICESAKGHVFEINPGGSILWEFWNPELWNGKRKTIYRFLRIPPEMVRNQLEH